MTSNMRMNSVLELAVLMIRFSISIWRLFAARSLASPLRSEMSRAIFSIATGSPEALRRSVVLRLIATSVPVVPLPRHVEVAEEPLLPERGKPHDKTGHLFLDQPGIREHHPDHLAPHVPSKGGELPVDLPDLALEVAYHEGVPHGIDNVPERLLRFTEFPLKALPVCNVGDRSDDAGDVPGASRRGRNCTRGATCSRSPAGHTWTSSELTGVPQAHGQEVGKSSGWKRGPSSNAFLPITSSRVNPVMISIPCSIPGSETLVEDDHALLQAPEDLVAETLAPHRGPGGLNPCRDVGDDP